MRILHVGNVAGVASTLAKYQQKLGHDTEVLVRHKHPFEYEENYCPHLFRGLVRFLNKDVIHYHSRAWISRMLSDKIRNPDFLLMKAMKKKIVWHFHGDDVRGQKVVRLNQSIFVSTPDLLEYVKDGVWLPSPLDLDLVHPLLKQKAQITIGYYDPIHPYCRQFTVENEVRRAVEQFRKKGVGIEVRPFRGYKHSEISAYWRDIDIWVDRFGVDFYGLCAIEAAAYKIPVIVQIGEYEHTFVPTCPFINTSRGRISNAIEYLLDENNRREIGNKGCEFVLDAHDPFKMAEKCIDAYQ